MKKKLLYAAIIVALYLIISPFISPKKAEIEEIPVNAGSEFEILFIDVGQADAALVSSDGHHMLVDGGNREDSDKIYTVLKNRGVEHLDYVVCTHAHEDHVGGLPAAISNFSVGKVFSSVESYDSKIFRTFVEKTNEKGLSLTIPELYDTYKLGDASITFIGPAEKSDEPNNMSLVVKIIYGNTSFLFTGDAERDAENAILENGVDISCDLLKVGHHGSETSTSYRFLYEANPKYAVISVGKDNSYGHPHEEVMSRLRDAEVEVFRTDLVGDILVRSDGNTLSFETSK